MNRLSVLLFVVALAGASPATASTLSLDLSNPTPTVGDTFTIDVVVTGTFGGKLGDELFAFGFDLTNSDGTIASLLSVVVGPLFDDLSGTFASTDVGGLVPAPPYSIIEGDIDSDPLLLATLTFSALQPGSVALGTWSDLSDANEGLMFLHYSNDDLSYSYPKDDLSRSVEVTVQAASVPETFSFGLPLGLMALAGARRYLRDR